MRAIKVYVLVFGKLINAVFQILLVKVLSQRLTSEEFGILALANVVVTLPLMLYFSPISSALARLFPITKDSGETRLLGSIWNKYSIIGGTALIVLASIAAYVIPDTSEWTKYRNMIPALVVLAWTSACSTLLHLIRNATSPSLLSTTIDTGEKLTVWFATFFLLDLFGRYAWVVINIQALFSLVFFLISSHFFNRYFYCARVDHDRSRPASTPKSYVNGSENICSLESKMMGFAYPCFIFGLFGWLQSASERWALYIFSSQETVGLYSILFQIGFHSQSIFYSAVAYSLLPFLFRAVGAMEESNISKANKLNDNVLLFIATTTPFALIASWYFSDKIILLLADKKYISVADFLPVVVLAGSIYQFAQIYSHRFLVVMRTDLLLFPKIASGFLSTLLIAVMSAHFKLLGVVVGSLLTSIIYLSFLMITWRFWERSHSQMTKTCFQSRNFAGLKPD